MFACAALSRAGVDLMRFKIEESVRAADFNVGYLERRSALNSEQPKGNFGKSDIGAIIDCVLVGLAENSVRYIPRALKWISEAIAEGTELYGWDTHYSDLHQARAMGEWLATGSYNPDDWDQARRLKESAWRGGKWSMQEVRESLPDYMAYCILAGGEPMLDVDAYEAGIEMYEYWMREHPISLKKLLKPREFGYALCRHFARNEFDGEELMAAGHRMLQANLAEEWFGMGQNMRAATWLMVVNWYSAPYLSEGKPQPTPLETILMAYDDMPGVTRPF
jgi:hypothetical protein